MSYSVCPCYFSQITCDKIDLVIGEATDCTIHVRINGKASKAAASGFHVAAADGIGRVGLLEPSMELSSEFGFSFTLVRPPNDTASSFFTVTISIAGLPLVNLAPPHLRLRTVDSNDVFAKAAQMMYLQRFGDVAIFLGTTHAGLVPHSPRLLFLRAKVHTLLGKVGSLVVQRNVSACKHWNVWTPSCLFFFFFWTVSCGINMWFA